MPLMQLISAQTWTFSYDLNLWSHVKKMKEKNACEIDVNTPKSHFSDIHMAKSPIHLQKRNMEPWSLSIKK